MSDVIPEGWSNTIFGELTESIKSGLSRRIVAQDIGIPVLISGNIQNNILDTNEFKYWYVNDPQGADTSRYLLNDGDILLCFINSMAQIGKVCIYRDIGRPAIYTTNLFRVVSNPSCSPVFVYQLMTYQTFQEEIQLITKPAVNQASFTKGDLVEIPVKLPPLPEQQKIAAILSSVDEVIEKTQAQISKLKDLKTGMMQELLSPREGQAATINNPQGESKNSLHHTEFKDSPLGRIPVGWDVQPFSEACSLIRDGTHLPPKRVPEGVALLSVRNMKNGRIVLLTDDTFVTQEFYDKMHLKWKPLSGDLLLAVVGATLGKVAQVPENFPVFTLQRSVAVLRGNSEILDNDFLHVYAQSKPFNKRLWDRANQTAQPGIYLAEIGKLLVPLPPLKEQKEIVRSVSGVDSLLGKKEAKVSSLQYIKKALMQDLLTGKVRVQVDAA